MENENNIEEKFIELLKKHGYTDDSIVRVTRHENIPCDILIKNGKRYVQAFEIKNNVSPRTINYFSQYVGTQKVNLPIYLVTYNNGGFEFYDSCSPCPLNESDVLSYSQATDAFVLEAKSVIIDRNNDRLKKACWIMATLFALMGISYFSFSFCETIYVCGAVAFAILTLFSTIIPFSDKLNVNIGDLELGIDFNQDKKTK